MIPLSIWIHMHIHSGFRILNKKSTLFLVLPLFLMHFAKSAQAQFFSPGSRSAAMGGAASTQVDLWALNNNVGALGFLDRAAAGLYYENRFILPETGTYGLHIAYPFQKLGSFGLSLSRFGYRQFSRNSVGIRYAKNFGPKVSAGIGMNYHYLFIGNGYGNASAFSAELGVLGKVNEELSLAFHLVNPVRMRITGYQNQRLPMIIRFGLSYNWVKKVITAIEIDAYPDQKPTLKLGVEYRPVELFQIRAGFTGMPLSGSFGFGFKYKPVWIDFSAVYHQQLGFSPQASLCFSFGKLRKIPSPLPRKKQKNPNRK